MSTFAISLHFSEVQVAHCTMDFSLWLLVLYGLFLPWLNSSHKHIHENTHDLKQSPVLGFEHGHNFWYVLASGSDIILQDSHDQNNLALAQVLSSLLTSECSRVDASLTVSLYTKPYYIFSYLWVVLDYLQGTFCSAPSLWEKKTLVYLDLFSGGNHYVQRLCQALHKSLGQWVTLRHCCNTDIINRKTSTDVLMNSQKASESEVFNDGLSFSWSWQALLLLHTSTCLNSSALIWLMAKALLKNTSIFVFLVLMVTLNIRSSADVSVLSYFSEI